jgi:large subunit ribosomal protein L32e
MENKKMLELRKKIKDRKPEFIGQEAHKKMRLKRKAKWKRPTGPQSKMRLKRKGYRSSIAVGYGSPKAAYGLHKSGLRFVKVCSIADLDSINPKTDGALISASLGTRKRIIVIQKAKEKGITLLNIKNADQWLKDTDDSIKARKEEKKKIAEAKESKKKEVEKKAEEKKKEGLAEKLTDEEKKQKEKEEKDKLLIKKNE